MNNPEDKSGVTSRLNESLAEEIRKRRLLAGQGVSDDSARVITPDQVEVARERAEGKEVKSSKRYALVRILGMSVVIVGIFGFLVFITVKALQRPVVEVNCPVTMNLFADEYAHYDSARAEYHKDSTRIAPVLSDKGYAALEAVYNSCDKYIQQHTNKDEGFDNTSNIAHLVFGRP